MLSEENLSWADLFEAAFRLDNGILVTGPNGGQGSLASILGGCYRHTWLAGVRNDKGEFVNPLSAFSMPLVKKEDVSFLEERMMLVQAGKEYINGKPVISRTASLINEMWSSLLRDGDPVGVKLHSRKLALAARYTEALANKDMASAVEAVNEYVDIRDKLCKRWISLAVGLIEFGLSFIPVYSIPPGSSGMKLEVFVPWIPQWNIHYHVGVDGISIFLVHLISYICCYRLEIQDNRDSSNLIKKNRFQI